MTSTGRSTDGETSSSTDGKTTDSTDGKPANSTDPKTASPTDPKTATVRQRIAAYLVDLVVVGGGVVAAAARLGESTRERLRLGGLLGLAVANAYHVVLEGTDGRTAGKRAVGIAVVTDDGEPCTYRAAAVRTAFRFVDWLPAGYLLGFASMGLTERCKRLGDLAADTVVVRDGDEDEDAGT